MIDFKKWQVNFYCESVNYCGMYVVLLLAVGLMHYCRSSREQSGTAFQLAASESVDEDGVFALVKRRFVAHAFDWPVRIDFVR
jgi:hypothetical protein